MLITPVSKRQHHTTLQHRNAQIPLLYNLFASCDQASFQRWQRRRPGAAALQLRPGPRPLIGRKAV